MSEVVNTVDLPQSIRIGAFTYVVTEMPVEEGDRHNVGGDFNHWHLQIRVRRDAKIQRQAEILMHEVLHGAWQNSHLGDREDEETVVSRIAIQMTQIMRDNPDFVRFMNVAAESGA